MDDLVDLINVIKKDFVSLDRLRGLQGGVGSYLVVRSKVKYSSVHLQLRTRRRKEGEKV